MDSSAGRRRQPGANRIDVACVGAGVSYLVPRVLEQAGLLKTLLGFGRGLKAPDVIKSHINVPEDRILSGAERVRAKCKPKLVVDVHSPQLESDCKNLLEQSGYHVKVVKNSPLLWEFRPLELNR